MEKIQPFKALSKICLNNWHYINNRILTFHKEINFFTGHSGSGKSTVIDALQIVLYANTDGRGFFNKAAADDSDRTLIEYLRGMVNISENNEPQYLRNQNFSSTIVLEFEQTDTKEKQCIGVVFDVETATNEITRLFFRHMGGLLENQYRIGKRCLSTLELREYLQRNFSKEDFFYGSSNERFRRQLYDIYLGGLDIDKFPRLFKRAIPFRMNIKLENFVKEYICMEQNIHIEDLQESVMQYGRMRNKIEETLEEIRCLGEIREHYVQFVEEGKKVESCDYQILRLEILQLQSSIQRLQDQIQTRQETISEQRAEEARSRENQEKLQENYDEIIRQIAGSGYQNLEREQKSLEETIKRLEVSHAKWRKVTEGLNQWKEQEMVPNQMLWDIEKFAEGTITEDELVRLKKSLENILEEVEEERQETNTRLRMVKKEEKNLREELKELKRGKKAYPKELEEAKYELRNRLQEKAGKYVPVHFLADLLDIREEYWHNAVEGYLGKNKLVLVVEPEFAKMAMEIFQEMDKKKYFRTSVLDTEQVLKKETKIKKGSLAEEVVSKEPYVMAYIRYILGHVIKCEGVEELRKCRTGITADCVLYQSYRLQHINSENYTRKAYIGETSMRQRILQLERKCEEYQNIRLPLTETIENLQKVKMMEKLSLSVDDYLLLRADIEEIPSKVQESKQLKEQIQQLREESVSALEVQKEEIRGKQKNLSEQLKKIQEQIWKSEKDVEQFRSELLKMNETLTEKEHIFTENMEYEQEFQEFLSGKRSTNYDYLRKNRVNERYPLEEKKEKAYRELVDVRSSYLRAYPNRSFSTSIENNQPYEQLLDRLQCEHLETYKEVAKEQARSAMEHFKDDFIFKIRSAIREAYQRKDELNRIISKLNFGKDKYQFVITKNKGTDGKYYKMFMDDSLQVNPSQLTNRIKNQLNMFTMEHEDQYGDMMNELIQIFIPPENATREELEEAKRNMEKYADYRTYLSFDMQQIVHGEQDMKIGLSKMIKKNSGGEGQNPLYVALLASFAQVYHINQTQKIQRNPAIRLVVLDEAFSKMDAEKVASCISLIRGLGIQAIISATNDKIQNYLENVDKTFVFANPNKKHISIQEFERQEFGQLQEET